MLAWKGVLELVQILINFSFSLEAMGIYSYFIQNYPLILKNIPLRPIKKCDSNFFKKSHKECNLKK